MSGNWKNWLPRLSWQSEDAEKQDLKVTLEQTRIFLRAANANVKALLFALAQSSEMNEGIRAETANLLGAIAFQHGGEITVKAEFFEALASSEENIKLTVTRDDAGNCTIKLNSDNIVDEATTPEEEEPDAPQTDEGDNNSQQE